MNYLLVVTFWPLLRGHIATPATEEPLRDERSIAEACNPKTSRRMPLSTFHRIMPEQRDAARPVMNSKGGRAKEFPPGAMKCPSTPPGRFDILFFQ